MESCSFEWHVYTACVSDISQRKVGQRKSRGTANKPWLKCNTDLPWLNVKSQAHFLAHGVGEPDSSWLVSPIIIPSSQSQVYEILVLR